MGIEAARWWASKVERLKRFTRSLRKVWWVSAAAGIAVVTLGAGGFAWWAWTWPMGDAERLTAIADSFAFAALIDAAVAAVFAVAAYYQATRGPELRLIAGLPNEILSFLPSEDAPPRDPLAFTRNPAHAAETLELHISILNLSKYSGRNPALRIQMDTQALNPSAQPIRNDWVVQPGHNSIQWDGGADFAAHGSWARPLPPLQLTVTGPPRETPYEFLCLLVAEGFRHNYMLRIKFVQP